MLSKSAAKKQIGKFTFILKNLVQFGTDLKR